jgi:thioesterase domain-containing protein/acyl carrier protein
LAQTAGVVSRHAASLSQIGGALTAAQPVAPGSGATDAGLASEIERQVAQMVAELLARAQVGRDENFFEVGGHSLLAARLMLRIHRQWGIDLPPRHFFAHPTVAALAVAVEQALDKPNPTDAAPQGIHAVPVVEGAAGRLPFFLMAGGGGSTVELLWYRDFIHNLGEDQPVYALLAHGPLGRGAIYASVGEMVVDAIAAVRRIQPHGPYLLGGECIGGKLAYEMARLLEQEGEEVALLLLLDTALPDGPTHRPAPSVQRWWRRMHYHWTHVQRLGWRAGTSHALELAGRALPPRLYANPHVRDAQAVREAYRRLLTDYAPAERYGRSLVVIFSAETQSRRQAWQKLAAEVDEHVVEGTHQTYLSVAVHQTAAKARSYLRRAQGLSATE